MVTMTRGQIEQIARLCVQEQGGSEAGVKGEVTTVSPSAQVHTALTLRMTFPT